LVKEGWEKYGGFLFRECKGGNGKGVSAKGLLRIG
jgi:hypothetical protein